MLITRTKSLSEKVGDPFIEGTAMGPVISSTHLRKIESYVEMATQEGGNVLVGGRVMTPEKLPTRCASGYFFEPTIIEGLDHHTSRVVQEEIFGPVCTLNRFESEAEAVEMANDVKYGLASSVWTGNVKKALRVSHDIHTGMVWVNAWMHRDLRVPFGGTKASGLGHEGGELSLNFYSEPKNICLKMM